MKRLSEKDKIQRKALDLFENNDHLLLTWSTGCGKTLAAIQCLGEYIQKRGLILVKETNHIQNWKDEFNKHGYEMLLEDDKVDILCYSSLHKIKNIYDICILDECHALSDDRFNKLSKLSFKKIVSLSATIDKSIKNKLDRLIKFKEYHISIDQAIKKGLLPIPEIKIIHVNLNNSKITHIYSKKKGLTKKHIIYNCNYSDRFKKLKELKNNKIPNYDLQISCTQKQYYDLITEDCNYFGNRYFKTNLELFKNKWVNKGSERKKFISECKTDILVNLLKDNDNKRLLCFTGSIEQCELVGKKDHIIHNEIKDRDKIVENFNNKIIDKLYCVKMLTESMNLNDIDVGIITQLDNLDRTFIQRCGRFFRSRNPLVYIIVAKDTQDEKYLENCLNGFNMSYVSFVKYK